MKWADLQRRIDTGEDSPSELQELLNAFGFVLTEKQVVPSAVVDDIDFGAVRSFLKAQGLDTEQAPQPAREDDLRNASVVDEFDGVLRPTLYGLMVFGRDPQAYPHTLSLFVQCAAYGGSDQAAEVLTAADGKGRLEDQVNRAMGWFRSLGRKESYQGLYRRDIPLVPENALREALVNAVIHRDYAITGSQVLLEVFDDRIVVTSPGALPSHMTVDQARNGGAPALPQRNDGERHGRQRTHGTPGARMVDDAACDDALQRDRAGPRQRRAQPIRPGDVSPAAGLRRMSSTTVVERLASSLEAAADHNPNDAVKPAAILWTDPDSRWQPIIPQLLPLMPHLLSSASTIPPTAADPRSGCAASSRGPWTLPDPRRVDAGPLPARCGPRGTGRSGELSPSPQTSDRAPVPGRLLETEERPGLDGGSLPRFRGRRPRTGRRRRRGHPGCHAPRSRRASCYHPGAGAAGPAPRSGGFRRALLRRSGQRPADLDERLRAGEGTLGWCPVERLPVALPGGFRLRPGEGRRVGRGGAARKARRGRGNRCGTGLPSPRRRTRVCPKLLRKAMPDDLFAERSSWPQNNEGGRNGPAARLFRNSKARRPPPGKRSSPSRTTTVSGAAGSGRSWERLLWRTPSAPGRAGHRRLERAWRGIHCADGRAVRR